MSAKKLYLENYSIIYPNFAGRQTTMNAEGNRNFCIHFIDPGTAKSLQKDGWHIRELKALDEGGAPSYILNVKVNFNGMRPPRIFVVKSSGTVQLDVATVAMLDHAPIETADLVLNPYQWTVGDASGIKAYLDTGYFVLDENKFDLKYAGTPPVCIGCPEPE